MAHRLFRPHLFSSPFRATPSFSVASITRSHAFRAGTGLAAVATGYSAVSSGSLARTHLCDGGGSLFGFGSSAGAATRKTAPARSRAGLTSEEAPTPLLVDGGLNPVAVRQIAAGSLSGAVIGICLGAISTPLLVLTGIVTAVVQALEWNGIRVIPYKRIRQAVSAYNIREALGNNSPFKITFTAMLLLTTVGSLE